MCGPIFGAHLEPFGLVLVTMCACRGCARALSGLPWSLRVPVATVCGRKLVARRFPPVVGPGAGGGMAIGLAVGLVAAQTRK
jgi:hypothetical protein